MTKAAKAPKTASPKTSSPETDPTWSYEATVAKIEATVTRLEQGELPLAAVFEEFEQAVADLQQCESRSEEHTSELQSRPHISYAVFCLKKKKKNK